MTPRLAIIALLLVGSVVTTGSQAQAGLGDLIPNLFGREGITLLPSGDPCCVAVGHQFQVTSLEELTTFNKALSGQITTFPLPSPASGFTFQLDPTTGVITRSTDSFGPIFAERAETVGRRKLSLGFTYSRFTFDKIDGKDLHNGEVELTFHHTPTEHHHDEPGGARPFFEADTITARLFADITSDVFILSATYGLLDNLDLSVAIPIIRLEMDVKGVAKINKIGTANHPLVHRFDESGADTKTFRSKDESTGLGDIVLRGKYNFYRQPPVQLAAALDLRLPSGDEDELRGLGTVRVRPFLIASARLFGIAPHVNIGFDLGDTSKLENEFFYNVGFDWAIVKPVTFVFDLLGRYVIDNKRPKAGVPGQTSDDHIVNASIGFKVNPWRAVLLLVNVLIPLNDVGLRDSIAPLIGLEVSF